MFPFGAVYKVYREHSLEEIQKNLKAIRDLGMNFVVVWPAVFWWEDPALPDYPYHTGKEILRYAETIGLKVIMETAGQIACLEYAPDFVMKDEYLTVTRDGLPDRDHGHWFFGFINYFHPEVRALMRGYLHGIAEQYRGFPALYGYDIWNETMFESHDPHTMARFQAWLQEKYGTLERLNDAWESTYSQWTQVRFSQLLWASVMPFVDYKEFHKDAIGMIVREWRDMVREVDTDHPVIVDNIHSMVTEDWSYKVRAQDDWVLAASADEMGISFYPKGHSQAMAPYRRALVFTAVRAAARDGRFWISEMQSHHQSIYNPFSSVAPHELRRWTLEAIAHGAKGLIYWKWNNFQKGLQTFGRGLVDAEGNLTERARIAGEIGQVLAADADAFVALAPRPARAAILYDRLCHDFTKAFTLAYVPTLSTTIYPDSIAGLFRCFWDIGVPLDVVTPADLLEGRVADYRVLFVTGQLNLSPEMGAALTAYAAAGGHVVLDGKCGEIGDDSLLSRRPPGGGLSELFGYKVGDMHPEGLEIRLSDAWTGNGGCAGDGAGIGNGGCTAEGKCVGESVLHGYYERRDVEGDLPADRVAGRYADGAPALVTTTHGAGGFLQILTLLWYGYDRQPGEPTRAFARTLAARHGLAPWRTDVAEVHLALKAGADAWLLFAFNDADTAKTCSVCLEDLPDGAYEAVELFTGRSAAFVHDGGAASLTLTCGANASDVYRIRRRT